MEQTEAARCIVVVRAGVLPGRPDPAYTRRYVITADQWSSVDGERQNQLLAETIGRATGYANLLMLQPERLNWVTSEWIWL